MNKIVILGNGVDWCELSLRKMYDYNDILIINKKIPVFKNYMRFLGRGVFSYKLNKKIDIPFKKLWYYDVYNRIKSFKSSESITLIIYDHNTFGGELSFLRFMRKKIEKIKIVYIFTNIIKYSAANERRYVEKLNDWYDVVFAFDPEDAKMYNFAYSPLIYDADPRYKKEKLESKDNLVFYVGQAKDRLNSLLSCFEKFQKLKIKTDFHITNVKSEEIKYADKIVYNKFITYQEAINSIQKSTCLLDIIQGDSTGLTIKTCEAVCYDKKLITTNRYVVEYPFYDPRYIRIVKSPDDIDEDFLIQNRDVHYSKEGKEYFSATKFLERLEKELSKQ